MIAQKIDCEISSQLSIKNIAIRFQLHEYFVNHNLLDFLGKFIDCYRSVTSTRKKLRGNNVAMQMFKYFSECMEINKVIVKQLFDELQRTNHELGTLSREELQLHVGIILSWYAIIVLKTSNTVSTSADCGQCSVTVVENDTGLLCLGGGTLGEIINVCKKRVKMTPLSHFQRQQASLQLQFAKMICMSREEKATLPAELINRDRGGMYFPRKHFLDFIVHANSSTLAYANKESFQRLGHDLIKVRLMTKRRDW